jgi:hypothetical protein
MVAGTISNLIANVSAAPGDPGDSWELTVFVDGAATGVTCTISGAGNSCTSAASVVIGPGALVTVEADPTGSPTVPANFAFTFQLTPA